MKREVLAARGTGRLAIEEVLQHPDRERLASALAIGVSEPMIAWARRVVRRGTDELLIAVADGRVALYMAARIAYFPADKQREFLHLAETGGGRCTLTVRCLTSIVIAEAERSA